MGPMFEAHQPIGERLGKPDLPLGLEVASRQAFRERELLQYWKACRNEDISERQDDLSMIAQHTTWPALRRRCAEALA